MAETKLRLIVFGGLPGTGKTTVARLVSGRIGAVHLRIDAIEQAIRDANGMPGDVGTAGYAEGNRLAEEHLAAGRSVVVDCVNPVEESRAAWRKIAKSAQALLLEVEFVCSDPAEHERRLAGREGDIPGLVLPTWPEVRGHHYEFWPGPHVTIDTAQTSIGDSVEKIVALK